MYRPRTLLMLDLVGRHYVRRVVVVRCRDILHGLRFQREIGCRRVYRTCKSGRPLCQGRMAIARQVERFDVCLGILRLGRYLGLRVADGSPHRCRLGVLPLLFVVPGGLPILVSALPCFVIVINYFARFLAIFAEQLDTLPASFPGFAIWSSFGIASPASPASLRCV